jgi:chromatin segregation and condensation protein Rec8/ScpA/Scc1 (kleisin family)
LNRAATRTEIIVTFLAVLELIKQYQIEVRQEALFDDIIILPTNETTNGERSELLKTRNSPGAEKEA